MREQKGLILARKLLVGRSEVEAMERERGGIGPGDAAFLRFLKSFIPQRRTARKTNLIDLGEYAVS